MTDHDYEVSRNSLIPLAESYANGIIGELPGTQSREEWADAWNVCFLSEMGRLAKECGLIK